MNKIDELIKHVKEADAIIVGAGSGMSNAAGMDFWYSASPLFMKHMKYFYDKYHFEGIFNGFYTRFDSKEEHWAFMLESLKMILNIPPQKPTYEYLKKLIGNKPVHFVTTNQDTLFKKFFPSDQVSEIQGSWDYYQASDTSTDQKLYSTKKMVAKLLPKVKDHCLPTELIPKSDINGSELILGARGPQFLEGKRYFEEHQKWNKFMADHRSEKILFLEMGVGRMTPMFMQEPFWKMTQYLKNSFYININPKDAMTNPMIHDRSLLIGDDINEVLKEVSAKIKEKDND
ncbi:Sir2 silent information regulator family NAD-dependent deacetylase [Lactobacillus helveticus]|uniref:Sir2 silent information regulator family NAD-dependent deacetylase n=1 Tax=Lactobacillus helveticus TaxID=1587 RepID=UPI001562506B|nr:Sir2 silent information regulator family NAD-dependent deacetylase [Lactobacillus helveticus]NRN84418.1 Protein ADP-ribosyltransferase [Lactobacillus helveticus]NRN99206.1 Protein ADP-ribosyltransferase [Lactobacillus helveticus]